VTEPENQILDYIEGLSPHARAIGLEVLSNETHRTLMHLPYAETISWEIRIPV
jgi:hypothetical protein|tara:strand:+ start:168 stop:326 length:159 start_codon:yes stop_codon:yes gene_type:complete